MSLAAEHERKKTAICDEGRGYIVDAHTHAAGHRIELQASDTAGCFYCCEVFPPEKIEDWIDNDECALCPHCGFDSVIGSASGFPVSDKKFLQEMNGFWF